MKERYHVTGMTCSACSSHVEKAVCKLAGIEKASVNLLTETMDVTYDEALLKDGDIIAAVVKAGYGASPMGAQGKSSTGGAGSTVAGAVSEESISGNNRDAGRDALQKQLDREAGNMRLRLGISLGFLIPLMYVAMYHMLQDWFGLPIPDLIMKAFHGNENAMNFALTQFLLLLPILYMNRKFFAVGFKTLLHRNPNMDSLIALGAGAAVGYGIFAMYRISYGLGHGDMALVEHYAHDLYFESAGTILTLITVGKYLESRSKGKTSEAITKLMNLAPKVAIVLREDGTEQEIPTELVNKGDIFLLKPGSTVPLDGTVIEGNSSVDESAITGESVPVEKQPGDRVVSATINKAGFLKCRADKVGEDTTLSQIIRLVEEASAAKAPIAKLADRVAGIFVPAVMVISLLTLIGWLLAGAEAEFAISTAIAVLVISCPCALGLATPVAIMVGTGVGAGHGILIKSGEVLQLAKEVDTVVLDKTGTITEGQLTVMTVSVCVPGMSLETFVGTVAAMEKQSEHTLAEAIVAYGQQFGYRLPAIKDFRAVFGRGVEAMLAEGDRAGTRYYVGNQSFLQEKNIEIAPLYQEGIDRLAEEGMTPLLVAEEGRFLGIIGVADNIKSTSQKAIRALKHMGIRVVMLTGDNRRTAEAVRQRLDIDEVIAEVLPQDKERHISELRAKGHRVAMIGDGINDAPALAAADVGMAIGAGTDVAMESADIILMKSDLRDAVTAIHLSRAVIRNIKQNLFWAFFYNCIGIPLAAGVLYPLFELRLTPMFGAAAMSMSSIFVVGNALRLRGFQSPLQKRGKRKTGNAVKGEGNSSTGNKEKADSLENEQINNNSQRREKIMTTEMTKVMKIEGMMCAHCTGRVQKTLEALEGVGEVVMSLEDKTATIQMNTEVADEVLTGAVTEAGYEVVSVESR